MKHTNVCCRLHVVFGTKNRLRSIPADLQPRLWEYMAGICRNLELKVLAVGGYDDHAHLLIGLPATIPIAECVQKIKANSSRWMRNDMQRAFEWQEGYSAFSVSVSHVDATVKYIRNQSTHHKKRTYAEELELMLLKHGIASSALHAGL